MKQIYDNQIREFVYEPYDVNLDGPLKPLHKTEELEKGFVLCEDSEGFKFIVKNYKQKNQKVFVVCDVLKEEE